MRPKLKITGQKEVMKKLAEFGKDSEKQVASLTFATAQEIGLNASDNLSAYGGQYKEIYQSINVDPKSDGHLFYSVNVNQVPMGAYLEFGTGAFVEVAPEWKDLAWSFYKNGQGTLRPHPFLYPAFTRGKAQYEKDLRNLLETLTKKHSK